ncbi:MAG TPA: NADH-quinone oxidoreductase subunit J [Chloroflexi bacterium]|nr:NADH-quinone oxidoreductase subunit J [Chloroflexota bacterium]
MPGVILFAILALVAILSAIGMLTSTNAVHAALFLVINLACIAVFFLGLSAPFLAMVQVTVYAGAIMVLFLFVIMLLGAERVPLSSRLRWQAPLAIALVLALLAVTLLVAFSPQVQGNLVNPRPVPPEAQGFGSPQAVGETLFARYLLPFQMVGLLLLVAMIGVVVLTKDERKPTGHISENAQASDRAA